MNLWFGSDFFYILYFGNVFQYMFALHSKVVQNLAAAVGSVHSAKQN